MNKRDRRLPKRFGEQALRKDLSSSSEEDEFKDNSMDDANFVAPEDVKTVKVPTKRRKVETLLNEVVHGQYLNLDDAFDEISQGQCTNKSTEKADDQHVLEPRGGTTDN